MKQSKVEYKCGNCCDGIVEQQLKETKTGVEITVKKCTSCKYQYGVKGLMSLIQFGKA